MSDDNDMGTALERQARDNAFSILSDLPREPTDRQIAIAFAKVLSAMTALEIAAKESDPAPEDTAPEDTPGPLCIEDKMHIVATAFIAWKDENLPIDDYHPHSQSGGYCLTFARIYALLSAAAQVRSAMYAINESVDPIAIDDVAVIDLLNWSEEE